MNGSKDNNGGDETLKELLKEGGVEKKECEEKNPEDDEGEKEEEKENEDNDEINSTEDAETLLFKAATCKEEGNAHFQGGSFDKAARSYRRGCSALKNLNSNNTGDEQVKSLLITLRTNLSMVCYKQDKHKQSRDIASQALAVNSKHVKALYRRALANRKLGDFDASKEDLKAALAIEPKNALVRKEFQIVKQHLDAVKAREKKALQAAFSGNKSNSLSLYEDKEEEKKKKEIDKKKKKEQEKKEQEKRKKQWEDECVHRMADNKPPITFEDWEKERKAKEKADRDRKKEEARKKQAAMQQARSLKSSSTINIDDDSDSDLDEKELKAMRGYKTTSDGRTTSYFNMELDENTKSLIGDIAPKKLANSSFTSNSNAPQPLSTNSFQKQKQSAWNSAQTWEEKDVTDWATKALEKHLLATKLTLQSCHIKITEIDTVKGDASFAISSGKKRYIFDFNAVVLFEFISLENVAKDANAMDIELHNDSNGKVLASGSYHLPDISSVVHDHKYEVELKWKHRPAREDESLAEYCHKAFVTTMQDSVKAFVLEFNSQY